MHPDAYLSCSVEGRAELKEKGSRFLALALPAASEEDAARLREHLRQLHPEASHHCWAQRLGPAAALLERHSDDGEPAGSAGPPIARAIQGSGLSDVLVVVTRWFGGTKLGVGGLIRAYGDVARAALAASAGEERLAMLRLSGRGPYDLEGKLRSLVEGRRGRILEARHGAEGVDWRLELPKSAAEEVRRTMLDLSRGRFILDHEES